MKFYMNPEFQRMNAIWRERLKQSGFEDLEDARGDLKHSICKNQGVYNQADIRDFFLRLDHLLAVDTQMPRIERVILTMYSAGQPIPKIVHQTRKSERTIWYVIKRYKGLIKTIDQMNDFAGFR
jgi:hypothetical protein